jgi:hypothetical protein
MSCSVSVQLPAGGSAQWQAAIRQANFDLVLNFDFDPLTASGFLPAKYKGEDSGFEYC